MTLMTMPPSLSCSSLPLPTALFQFFLCFIILGEQPRSWGYIIVTIFLELIAPKSEQ